MAKSDKGTNGAVSMNPEIEALISGLDDVSEPDIAGWFQPIDGAEFCGNALKVIQIDDDDGNPRDVLLVKLKAACATATLNGEPVQVPAGSVLGVGMRFGLQELLCYVEKQGLVYAKALNKMKLKGGRSKWNWKINADKKKRSAPVAATARVAGGESSDTGGF
jgi:hypothetical protein